MRRREHATNNSDQSMSARPFSASRRTKSIGFAAGLLAAVVVAGCGGGNTSFVNNQNGPRAASVIGTIAVGTAPSAIAVDSTSNKIYVADFGTQLTFSGSQACSPTGSDVMVIDGATESSRQAQFASPLWNPYAIAVSPTNHAAYVLVRGFETSVTGSECSLVNLEAGVDLIDTTTFKEVGPADEISACCVGGFTSIAGNQLTGDTYVGTVFGLGAEGITIVKSSGTTFVPFDWFPGPMAVNQKTNNIYVAFGGLIFVLDEAGNSTGVSATNPNAVNWNPIAVNPTTNKLYLADKESNNLFVLDGTSLAVSETIPLPASPVALDVDPQTNFIYLANGGNSQAGDPGSITVIDAAKQTTTMSSDPNAKNPVAVAVNPVTNRIYVANSGSNNVTVIAGAHD